MNHIKKRALKKLTKSEKKRGAAIREEIDWLEKAQNKWPFSIPVKGEKHRLLYLLLLKIELDKIYGEGNRQQQYV